MITGILGDIKKDRAKFVRELAYIRENAEEDYLADRVEKAERAFGGKADTFENYAEAATIIETMSDDESAEDASELQKILESVEDLTFDEMIGIE